MVGGVVPMVGMSSSEGLPYNIQYTHILDELTSYIMGQKDFSAFLQIISWLTTAVSMGYS